MLVSEETRASRSIPELCFRQGAWVISLEQGLMVSLDVVRDNGAIKVFAQVPKGDGLLVDLIEEVSDELQPIIRHSRVW